MHQVKLKDPLNKCKYGFFFLRILADTDFWHLNFALAQYMSTMLSKMGIIVKFSQELWAA